MRRRRMRRSGIGPPLNATPERYGQCYAQLVRFYQESRRTRIVQSAIFILLAAAAVFDLLHGHPWRAGLSFVLSAVLLRSLWTKYWEIEPNGTLRHKAYGFDLSLSAADVCYAGPVRRD